MENSESFVEKVGTWYAQEYKENHGHSVPTVFFQVGEEFTSAVMAMPQASIPSFLKTISATPDCTDIAVMYSKVKEKKIAFICQFFSHLSADGNTGADNCFVLEEGETPDAPIVRSFRDKATFGFTNPFIK